MEIAVAALVLAFTIWLSVTTVGLSPALKPIVTGIACVALAVIVLVFARRLVSGALVTATLLCCDAWFDVILDLGTSGQWVSIASALVVELPIAFLMFAAARRLIRLSALVAVGGSAAGESPPSLWRMALVGDRTRPSE